MKLYDQVKTIKHAIEKIDKSHDAFLKLLRERVTQREGSSRRRRQLDALTGFASMEGELRNTDIVARKRFAHHLVRDIRDLREANPRLRFFHIVCLADEGITSDRRPFIAHDPLSRKAYRALSKLGLNGIFSIEISGLMNWPQKGRGRRLVAHVHMLVWADPRYHDGVRLDEGSIELELGSKAWSCQFGATPVLATEITPDLGCPSFWAAYLLKAPYEAINLYEISELRGRTLVFPQQRMRSTTAGYRAEFAAIIFRVFSRMRLYGTVHGVGGGVSILNRTKSRINRWQKTRKFERPAAKRFSVERFFRWLESKRRKKYRRPFIDGYTVS